jgi:DNA-binding response OmpR family regulator
MGAGCTTGRTVLHVEDSPTDARLVQAALKSCNIRHAADLTSALGHLRSPGIDLVLLDLHLPESRGLETLRIVQEASPGVPVIVVTGSESEALAQQVLDQGAEDIVQKGTSTFVEVLRRALRNAVERLDVLEAMGAAAHSRNGSLHPMAR